MKESNNNENGQGQDSQSTSNKSGEKTNKRFIKVPYEILGADMPANAKLLYGLILSLSKQKGYCYANNRHLANKLGLSKSAISTNVSVLVDNAYVFIKEIPHDDSYITKQRRLAPNYSKNEGGQQSDTPIQESVPPIQNEGIGSQNASTGGHDDGIPSQDADSGVHDTEPSGQLDRNIIDNNRKEEVDNLNRKEIDNKNSVAGIHSSSKDSSNENNSINNNLSGYYTNQEVEFYFKDKMFQMYWRAAKGNTNHRTKEQLLSIDLHQRRYNDSYELFNKICSTVDEKNTLHRKANLEYEQSQKLNNNPISSTNTLSQNDILIDNEISTEELTTSTEVNNTNSLTLTDEEYIKYQSANSTRETLFQHVFSRLNITNEEEQLKAIKLAYPIIENEKINNFLPSSIEMVVNGIKDEFEPSQLYSIKEIMGMDVEDEKPKDDTQDQISLDGVEYDTKDFPF